LYSSVVLPPSACPSSNGLDLIITNLNAFYLDTTTSKRAIRPLDLEILQKERQQGIERTTTPKEHKRKNDLALSTDVRSLDQRTGVVIR
jgi:hypothetical protein